MKTVLLKTIKFAPIILLFVLAFVFSVPSLADEAKQTIRSFFKAEEVQPGDTVFLLNENGQLIPEIIIGKEWIEKQVETYNLEIEKTKTYFANDFAVHNQKQAKTKAYFYWDQDKDGCHDNAAVPAVYPSDYSCNGIDDRTGSLSFSEPVVVAAQDLANIMNAIPGGQQAVRGPAYYHHTNSYEGDSGTSDKWVSSRLLNGGSGMVTVYNDFTYGASMPDGHDYADRGNQAPFAQTDRNADFRVGGVHFRDYDTGAPRPVYRYTSVHHDSGRVERWNSPIDPQACLPRYLAGNPCIVRNGDLKEERDFPGDEVSDFGTHYSEELYTQAALFTVDYTGRYYFGQFGSIVGDGADARIYEITTPNPPNPIPVPGGTGNVGGLSCDYFPDCSDYEDCRCTRDIDRNQPLPGTPSAFGYPSANDSNIRCSATSIRFMYSSSQTCNLDKDRTYLMTITSQGGGSGNHARWSWPFLMWDKARLYSWWLDSPGGLVAAIPLVKAGPTTGTIQARVWNETTNCAFDGGESAVSTSVPSVSGTPAANPTSGDTSTAFSVTPDTAYTVTVNIPAGYTIRTGCAGITCAGTQCSRNNISAAAGQTAYADFPLVAVSTITGHVWDDTPDPDQAVCSQGAGPNLPGWRVSVLPVGTNTTTDGNGNYTLSNIPNGNNRQVCVTPPAGETGWQLNCTRRDGSPAGVLVFCTTTFNLTGNTAVNFGLVYQASPWIQTAVGDVAAGTTVQSLIPDPTQVKRYDDNPGEPNLSCDNSICNPAGPNVFPGLVIAQNSGSIVINQPGGRVSDRLWEVPGSGGGAGTYDVFTSPGLADSHYSGLENALRSRVQNIIETGGATAPIRNGQIRFGSPPYTQIRDDMVYLINGNAVIENDTAFNNVSATILINGNLTVASNFVPTNDGFYAFIVSGTVTVDPAVQELKGIFLADGSFSTGTTINLNQGLKITGMAISWTSFGLGRDWNDNRRPTEFFVYDPRFLVELRESLGESKVRWREI